MQYFIIAGEASGDLHGAELIKAIRKQDPEADIVFIGGDKMAAAAERKPIVHYREMNYMGFSEVLRNIFKLRRILARTQSALRMIRPDCIILIDYPSFNLRVAKFASKVGIPTYLYISPKIWAWKKWRMKTIRRVARQVLCILPFEPHFYTAHGYARANYVGNPSVGEVSAALSSAPDRNEFLSQAALPDRPIVALMPGSREGEIRNNLPIMQKAMEMLPQCQGVIAAAPSVPDEVYRRYSSLPLVRDNAIALLKHSRAALVTSGTATLETALVGTPQVVLYRANGSRLSYKIMKSALSVNFVSLPNLIAERQVVPELLLHHCKPAAVADALKTLLDDTEERADQIRGYQEVRRKLGKNNAGVVAAHRIIDEMQ